MPPATETFDHEKIKVDRSIDPKQLDVEAVALPDLIGDWGREAIEARYRKEALELQLSRLESDLETKVRRNPEKYGIEKVTDKSISAKVKTIASYTEVEDQILEATRTFGHFDMAMKALEVKRRMLEYLGDLHGKLYFAGPEIPRDLISEAGIYREAARSGALYRQGEKGRKGGTKE